MEVVVYSRPGCHLCEEARAVVLAARARTPFELVEIDIEGDDDLVREYGPRVPVIVVDGREAFEYTVDAAALTALVTRQDR